MTAPAEPRISILLPCKDATSTLEAAIASLEAQTEPRWEALVLDDGSADGTAALLGAWAERDARVRLLRREGEGLVDALRQLSAAARAPLLARMDADDVALPERLAAQRTLLRERPGIAACGTGVRYVPRPAPGSGYLRYERWLNGLVEPEELLRDLYVECPIAHPTLMVRRRAFRAAGGYREIDGPEDYDLVLRLARAGGGLANVPRVLHEWRLGPGRLSELSARYAAEAFRRLKVAFLADEVPRGRPLVIWGAGRVGKAFARAWRAGARAREPASGTPEPARGAPPPAAAGRPIAAFVDLDPRKIGQRIHDVPVIEPGDLPSGGQGGRPYTLLAVGSPGAREEIREALDGLGFREVEDYRAVA